MIPPSFDGKLQSQHRCEGEAVKLQIKVCGEPTPEVSWYRDGRRLISSKDFEITQEGDLHSLYIPEVFYEDAGEFSVKACNMAGKTFSSTNLSVKSKCL